MAHSSNTTGRAVGAALTLASLLPACGVAELERTSEGLDVGAATEALRAGAGLALTGTSNLTSLPPAEGYAQLFDGFFNLSNNTGKPVTINKQLFFFAAPGGYAYPSPSFDIGGRACRLLPLRKEQDRSVGDGPHPSRIWWLASTARPTPERTSPCWAGFQSLPLASRRQPLRLTRTISTLVCRGRSRS